MELERKIMKKTYCRGSFTIECAMLMPMILLCIVAIMWLMIIMYDKNVMDRALVHAVLEAEHNPGMSMTKLKKEIEKRIYDDLEGQLVGVKDVKVTVRVEMTKIRATIEAEAGISDNIPFATKLNEIKSEVVERRLSGADLIMDVRRIKALYDIVKNLTDDGMEDTSEMEGE